MSAAALVSMNVWISVRVSVRGVGVGVGVGRMGPHVSGSCQLAFVQKSSIMSTGCVAFLVCLCLCVSPQICSVLRHKTASYKGSVAMPGLYCRLGSWVRVEGASSPPEPQGPWAFQKPVLRVLI